MGKKSGSSRVKQAKEERKEERKEKRESGREWGREEPFQEGKGGQQYQMMQRGPGEYIMTEAHKE